MERPTADLTLALMWSGSNTRESIPTAAMAHDQGLLRGWGVFETMLAIGLEVPLWARHWARLQYGARQLDIPLPPEPVFLEAVQQTLVAANSTFPQAVATATCYRLRLTVTAGEGSTWSQPGEAPTCVLTAATWTVPPPMAEQTGLHLLTYPQPFPTSTVLRGCKHTSYLPWLMAARYARLHGRDDAVLLDSIGNVSETSHRNLFVWRDEQLWTPPLTSGCLPGVMRGRLLEIAGRMGVAVRERPLALPDALEAEHVFLTSAVTFCQSVVRWEERSFAVAQWPLALQDLERELRHALPAQRP